MKIPPNAVLHEFSFYIADENFVRSLPGSQNWDLLASSRIASDTMIANYVPRFFRDMDLEALDQAFENVLITGESTDHPFELMFALKTIVASSARKVLANFTRSDESELVEASTELTNIGIGLNLIELAVGQQVWPIVKNIQYPTVAIITNEDASKIVSQMNALDDLDALGDYAFDVVEAIQKLSIAEGECLVSLCSQEGRAVYMIRGQIDPQGGR